MRTLKVNVGRADSECPIWIGSGLLSGLEKLLKSNSYSSVVIVADSHAADRWLAPIVSALSIQGDNVLLLHGGEEIKDVRGLESLWTFFSERKLDRRSLVINLGGGSLSDLSGFAASTYMRGVAFVHIPTTLLAQVDASIGGKTGVNFNGVKNLLGALSQPAAVVIDVDTLSTLPPREFRSGFAEIVKHGLIADEAYFEHTTSRSCTEWDTPGLTEIVTRSCEIKRDIVMADVTEQGVRKVLNFGHTIGHAVEAYAINSPEPLTHGEAVCIGMVGEALISFKTGKIEESAFEHIVQQIQAAGLPVSLPKPVEVATLRAIVGRDKKNVGNSVKWTLLNKIGGAVFDVVIAEEQILDALAYIQPSS